MDDDDWDRLNKECARLLENWRSDNWLNPNEVSGFEYGFELGFRVAMGEDVR